MGPLGNKGHFFVHPHPSYYQEPQPFTVPYTQKAVLIHLVPIQWDFHPQRRIG